VIGEVSQALIDLIHRATPDLAPWVEQHSLSAADTAPPDSKAALALVAVEPHPFTINDPLVEGIAGLVRPPLSLKLHYLITHYNAGDFAEVQLRLGRIVQAFHTTPILRSPDLQPTLADLVETITIRLASPMPDERAHIWGLLGRPGRVALFYEVDVAPVPVLEREGAGRIKRHRIDYVGAP
jgi:hypothetical protein